MTADGLSLPTTIAQAGDVARTQVRAQQTHQPSTPASEQLAQSRDTKVQRAQKAPAGERRRIQEDEERRRHRRREPGSNEPGQLADPETPQTTAMAVSAPDPQSLEDVGQHVDTRA